MELTEVTESNQSIHLKGRKQVFEMLILLNTFEIDMSSNKQFIT